jgi:rsbT antagonist protein RsbS
MNNIPILKIDEFLVVSIQVEMHDRLALNLQADLADTLLKSRCRGVLIDISAVDMVDSFIGRVLADIATVSSLSGAPTVVVGMKPFVAITLVELGLALEGVKTALNVERGMRFLRESMREDKTMALAPAPEPAAA